MWSRGIWWRSVYEGRVEIEATFEISKNWVLLCKHFDNPYLNQFCYVWIHLQHIGILNSISQSVGKRGNVDMDTKKATDDIVSITDTKCLRQLGIKDNVVTSAAEGSLQGLEQKVFDGKHMEEVSTTSRQERIRKLLVISLSVTLKNVSDLLGDETAKEILSIIHNESFDVEVFKRMIKSVEDCYTITKGIMHTYKDN
jgi:hypothetical protein